MAKNRQAMKRQRQNLKRRERNRHYRSTLRTFVKRVRMAVSEGKLPDAKKALARAEHVIDRVAVKGIVHQNMAARTKSRLHRLVAGLASKS
ncbi:MAG: 30S ribosomal protein S20 [Deltaproteobacteria bacterium]|nr:30S ribosomal protein S20 [Deltaproteobacteria bacterium]